MSRDLAMDVSHVKHGNGNLIGTPPLAREVYGAPTPPTMTRDIKYQPQKGVAGGSKNVRRAAQS